MGVLEQVVGLAGMRAAKTVLHRMITRGGWIPDILPQGRVISGACSRDPSNTVDVTRLQAGLLMGKIATVVNSLGTVGFYAPSVLGATAGALTSSGTSLTLSAAAAAELVRRCGASGTFTLTGPTSANGVARSATVTYSAVNTTTGVVTVTAVGVNEVQELDFNIAATGGTLTLIVPKANGQMITTTAASWSATDATYLSNLQAVLDVATGVSGGIVASAIPATDTDLGFIFTFSGAGYAGLPQPLIQVTSTLPTSSTTWTVKRNTAGVGGAFVAGSFVGPTDGSQTPLTFLPSGWPMPVVDGSGVSTDVEFAELPVGCIVDSAMLLPVWPTDTGLQNWITSNLSNAAGGKFVFSTSY